MFGCVVEWMRVRVFELADMGSGRCWRNLWTGDLVICRGVCELCNTPASFASQPADA